MSKVSSLFLFVLFVPVLSAAAPGLPSSLPGDSAKATAPPPTGIVASDAAHQVSGEAQALYEKGIALFLGEEGPLQYQHAREILTRAADLGHPKAQAKLGQMYRYGLGGPIDALKALDYYRKAAAQNDPSGQDGVGDAYSGGLNGAGIAKDLRIAFTWYSRSASQGFPMGNWDLGLMYLHGTGTDKNEDLALLHFKKAMAEYRRRAEQGDPEGQHLLAMMLRAGQGASRDEKQSLEYLRKSASQGYAFAQYELGVCYANSDGITGDYAEAVKWYRKAADKGFPNAQSNLGYCYEHGYGVPKDSVEALKWYRKAAEAGYPSAQYNLGYSYEHGNGVPKDSAMAEKWYRTFAESRDPSSGFISEQWWTEDALISLHRQFYPGDNAGAADKWITKEDRHGGAITAMLAPPETKHLAYADGVFLAWTYHYYQPPPLTKEQMTAPFQVNQSVLEAQEKARAEVEVGHLYRCSDFANWELLGTIKPGSSGIHIYRAEPLVDNRVLFQGLFPTQTQREKYAAGAIGIDGQVHIDTLVKTIGLDLTGANQPFFNDVARTRDHIIVYSRGHGYLQIFSAKTGEFQRLVRCWDYPSEMDDGQNYPTLIGDVLLALRPRADGTILVVSREAGFAKGLKEMTQVKTPAAPRVLKSYASISQAIQKNMNETNDYFEKLTKAFPEVVWRILDPMTGTWTKIQAPAGCTSRFEHSGDAFGFQVDCIWDGSFRCRSDR